MFRGHLTFQKYDKYDNGIFISRPSDESYEDLKDLNDKLKNYNSEVSNPIYINDEYEFITLRTVKDKLFVFQEKSIYNVTIKLTHKKIDEKQYINAILIRSRLTKKYIQDHGTDIVL